MRLSEIGMIAADTARSKAYLQALVRDGLCPNFVLVLRPDTETGKMPGQSGFETKEKGKPAPSIIGKPVAPAGFHPEQSLEETLLAGQIDHVALATKDVHDPHVVELLESRTESVFIYSGFGGVILKPSILSIGIEFLHVHGGFLPDYKGSTTNYYSLLEEDLCGASSLFLNEEIDSGPVLLRRTFPPPEDKTKIDYIYDSLFRAQVLIETVQRYVANGEKWEYDLEQNKGGDTFYIIHPVLKHLAILR